MVRIASVAAVLLSLLFPMAAEAARAELEYQGEQSEFTGKGYVHYSAYRLRFDAEPGEPNAVALRRAGAGALRLQDGAAAIAAGPGCAAEPGGVVCSVTPASARIVEVSITLGDGADRVRSDGVSARVDGGEGDDEGSIVNDTPFGEGTLTFDGGSGSDSLRAEGSAYATASYAGRSAPVQASLDGVANDGESGEGDTLGPRVTTVLGGSGPDRLDAAGTPRVELRAGAGVDRVVGGPGPDMLDGGPGDDIVEAGSGEDQVIGGSGDDTIRGGDDFDRLIGHGVPPASGERNTLYGEGGRDELVVGGGTADDAQGGEGTDEASYVYAGTAGVRVSLDDRADDGADGEGDNIRSDVENVRSTGARDHLVGSAAPNELVGGGGGDTIDGGGGADRLGGSGDLRDASTLVGGPGTDVFTAVTPADDVDAADGEPDVILCSTGGGVFRADKLDTSSECAPFTALALAGRRIRVDARGRIRTTASCSRFSEMSCRGRIVLTRSRRTVVRRDFALRPARKAHRLALRLSPRWMAELRRRGSLHVVARVETRRQAPAEIRVGSDRWTLLAPRR